MIHNFVPILLARLKSGFKPKALRQPVEAVEKTLKASNVT